MNGRTAHYLYDGLQVIAEWSDTGAATIYLNGLGLDEALARYTQAGERTQLTDALGSVVMETDANAEITAQYAYSPYGQVVQTGEAENPVQYTARENDGTGLYYYRARYYDPQVKRFVSEDPIGVAGGLNLYAYVSGNPISLMDPNGLCPMGDVMCELANRAAGMPMPIVKRRSDGLPQGAGCGDASTDCLVPDRLAGGNLLPACSRHDDCYETVGASRGYCDSRLGEDIKKACDLGKAGALCYVASWFYPTAIGLNYHFQRLVGNKTPFHSAQENAK